jgi:hypothetical protein
VLFGHGQPEEVGPRKLRPQTLVESIVCELDLGDAFVGRDAAEHRLGGLAHGLLRFVECEVHQGPSPDAGLKTGSVNPSP